MEACFSILTLTDLATRAQREWRRKSDEARLLILESYALVEILNIGHGAEASDLWALPQSIATRLVVDFGCREEASRRGHEPDAPFERAVTQAVELQDFRRALDAAVRSIEQWPQFMSRVRATAEGSGCR